MKPFKLLSILFIASAVSISAFSQTNPVLNYLPENFKMVVKVNPISLLLKVKLDELSKNKMFEGMIKGAPENGKQILGNPLQSGISFGKGVFFVNTENSNGKPEVVIYAIPSNTTQLEATIKKMFPDKIPVKIGESNLIIGKNIAVAWNNDIIILTGDDAKKDSSTITEAEQSLRIQQLTDRCTTLINKHEPLQNEYLLSLLNDQSDLSICRNNSIKSLFNKKNSAILNMLGQNTINKGNYTTISVNFEKGKIVAETKQYIDKPTDSLFKKYVLTNINTALLKKLPSDNPVILCSFSLPLDLIKESISKVSGGKAPSEDDKKKMDDVFSSINGDLTIAVLKAHEVATEDSVTKSMGGMEIFVAGGIGDKEKFKSLDTLLESKSAQSEKNSLGKAKPVILSNNSFFVMSVSPYLAQQFLNAGDNKEMSDLIEPYKNSPSFFMVDLKTVFGFLIQSSFKGKSEEDMKQSMAVLGLFDKLIAYCSSHNDKYMGTTVEVTMTDKDENSLMQFINLIDVFYSMKAKTQETKNN